MQERSRTTFTPPSQIALATFSRCSANYQTALKTSGSMPSFATVKRSRTFLSGSRRHAHRWSCDTCEMSPTIVGSIGNTPSGFYPRAISTNGCGKAGECPRVLFRTRFRCSCSGRRIRDGSAPQRYPCGHTYRSPGCSNAGKRKPFVIRGGIQSGARENCQHAGAAARMARAGLPNAPLTRPPGPCSSFRAWRNMAARARRAVCR